MRVASLGIIRQFSRAEGFGNVLAFKGLIVRAVDRDEAVGCALPFIELEKVPGAGIGQECIQSVCTFHFW